MMITDFTEMEAAGKVRQYSPCKLSWGDGQLAHYSAGRGKWVAAGDDEG